MSALQLLAVMFGLMLTLMAFRIPIAAAMFLAGGVGYVTQTGWSGFANYLNAQAFARFASYDLSVIPLFILMGHFATQGGISRALFRFAASITGRFKGGMAMAAVLASAAFGAICGSSVATAATITGVALPELRRHGYSGRLATGTLAAAGTLGILIPPSVPLVIYAILAEQNIAKLFAAAMIPGLIATLGYLAVIAIYVRVVPGHSPEVDRQAPGFDAGLLWSVAPILCIFSHRFRRHLRRVLHADRRRWRWSRFNPGDRLASTRTELGGVQRVLFCNRRKFRHDFFDFSGCRRDERRTGAQWRDKPTERFREPAWLVAAHNRGGDPALLCGARRGDGRTLHDSLNYTDLFPACDGPGFRDAQRIRGHLVRHHGADGG